MIFSSVISAAIRALVLVMLIADYSRTKDKLDRYEDCLSDSPGRIADNP